MVKAKEALIIAGRRLGATNKMLSDLTGLDTATISRRHDSGIKRLNDDTEMTSLLQKVVKIYKTEPRESSISQA